MLLPPFSPSVRTASSVATHAPPPLLSLPRPHPRRGSNQADDIMPQPAVPLARGESAGDVVGVSGAASPVPVAVAMSIGHNVGLALEGGDVVKDLPGGGARCVVWGGPCSCSSVRSLIPSFVRSCRV